MAPLELIFSDVWDPILIFCGSKYYISFINDFYKFMWVYLMNDRTDVHHIFFISQAHVEHLLDTKIKCVQSNWGGEYQKLHNQFFIKWAPPIMCHVLIPISKMVQLNTNIIVLLKSVSFS